VRELRNFILLGTLLVSSTHRTAAEHPWFEVRSPHFTVICNGSEKDGRDAAVDLERTRAVFMKALPSLRQDPNVPIVVFVTPDENTFATLVPIYRERLGGNKPYSIFQRGRDRNYIVMRIGFRISTEFSVKYDYAGLLAGVNFRRAPLWFRTGVAEFFAVSEITEDQAKVGMPSPRFVRRLETMHLVPFPRLFNVGTNSPEYTDPEQRWAFEAESWGLFHYLIIGDHGEHRQQLEVYLQLLAQGKKQLDAAEQAFGDLGKLQDRLGPYYRQKGFPFAKVEIPREDYAQQLALRNLGTAESNARLAEYHLRFKRTAEAKPLIDAALSETPGLSLAHEAMGTYDILQADYENAVKEFSAATTAEPSFFSYYYKGVLSSYWKAPADIPDSSERDLRRAVELAPRYAPACMALARLLVRKGGNVTEAVAFARRAVDAEPNRVRYHLALANILLLAGEASQADAESRQALGYELSPLEEEDANTLLSLAQACKPGGPCKALGDRESASGSETLAESSAPHTGQNGVAPFSKARGVVRSIACSPDGRVITLTSQGKDLTFHMNKTTRVSLPETFWLATESIDICKHFAGEPAVVRYKSEQPDSSPLEATALEIADKY
jgi:tetratricopeptide (TPR) repeat protein